MLPQIFFFPRYDVFIFLMFFFKYNFERLDKIEISNPIMGLRKTNLRDLCKTTPMRKVFVRLIYVRPPLKQSTNPTSHPFSQLSLNPSALRLQAYLITSMHPPNQQFVHPSSQHTSSHHSFCHPSIHPTSNSII